MSDDCTCDGCRGDYPPAVREAWAEQRKVLASPPPRHDDAIRVESDAIIRKRFPCTPEHVRGYRTSPRPQPRLPRKTPWWRLVMWRIRGGPERLKIARARRALGQEHSRDEWKLRQRTAEVLCTVAEIVSAGGTPDADVVAYARTASEIAASTERLLETVKRSSASLEDVRVRLAELSPGGPCRVCGAAPGERCDAGLHS